MNEEAQRVRARAPPLVRPLNDHQRLSGPIPTMSSSPPSTSASATPAVASSILLPTPSGPQDGITPQPPVDELAVQVRKTRLTGPEIVQLPPDGGYASDNDTDAESEASIGEDGEPKARDMLKDLPDETDVSFAPSSKQDSPVHLNSATARRAMVLSSHKV